VCYEQGQLGKSGERTSYDEPGVSRSMGILINIKNKQGILNTPLLRTLDITERARNGCRWRHLRIGRLGTWKVSDGFGSVLDESRLLQPGRGLYRQSPHRQALFFDWLGVMYRIVSTRLMQAYVNVP
jgi:hypothetical protein